MNWFKFYFFGNWEKVTNVNISYSLITKSGNTILTLNENYVPDKIIKNFTMNNLWKNLDEIKAELKPIFDKRALELLKEYTLDNLKNIKYGYLITGDYIIECSWDISVEHDSINWEEYKEWDKLYYV